MDNLESFSPLLAELEKSDFDISSLDLVSIDFPGHGFSEHRPPGIQQYFIDSIPVIWSIVDVLHWQRLCIIGHSMGAGVAALFSGVFPEMVSHLLLLDGLGPLSDAPDRAPIRLRQAILESVQNKEKRPPVYDSLEKAARVRARSSQISVETAHLLVERAMQSCEGGYTWRHDPRLKTASAARMTEAQVQSFLYAIDAYTLAIMAEDSRFIKLAQRVGGRVDCFKQLELVRVSGGHHVHMEQPKLVLDHVLPFLHDYLAVHRSALD